MNSSIRTKLLLIVCLTFLFSTAAILYFGIVTTKRIIISESEKAYSTQLEVILNTLQNRHAKLVDSGIEGLFADGYKKSTAADLGALYYANNPIIYPFIVDNTGRVVLHQRLESGSTELAREASTHTMLATKNGMQQYRWRGEDKWMVYRTFEPWKWTVGYSMKNSSKE